MASPAKGLKLFGCPSSCHLARELVLCSVYRPGSCSGTDIDLITYIDQTIPAIRRFGSKLILAGDFNVHREAWLNSTKTTHAGEMMENLCAFHGLLQHVDQPTRGLNTLDLVMSDMGCPAAVCTLAPPLGSSDHACVVVDFAIQTQSEPNTRRTVWRYTDADWDRLAHFFATTNWDDLMSSEPNSNCSHIRPISLKV